MRTGFCRAGEIFHAPELKLTTQILLYITYILQKKKPHCNKPSLFLLKPAHQTFRRETGYLLYLKCWRLITL